MFVGENANNGYIAQLVKQFNVEVNVLYGSIELIQSRPIGSLFVAVNGPPEQIAQAVEYLQKEGVGVNILQQNTLAGKEEVV
ncbi:MAG: NIL domain-containing protein [Oscillospiraceae bacterium]